MSDYDTFQIKELAHLPIFCAFLPRKAYSRVLCEAIESRFPVSLLVNGQVVCGMRSGEVWSKRKGRGGGVKFQGWREGDVRRGIRVEGKWGILCKHFNVMSSTGTMQSSDIWQVACGIKRVCVWGRDLCGIYRQGISLHSFPSLSDFQRDEGYPNYAIK